MNLYELSQNFNNLIEVLENTEDENIKELIKKSMDQLTIQTNEKIENIIKYIKNLEAEAEALEKEAKRLNDRKIKTLKKVDNLKGYLKDFTSSLESKKYHTGIFNISIRKNAAAVVVDNEFLVPDEFCKTEIMFSIFSLVSKVNWSIDFLINSFMFSSSVFSSTSIKLLKFWLSSYKFIY